MPRSKRARIGTQAKQASTVSKPQRCSKRVRTRNKAVVLKDKNQHRQSSRCLMKLPSTDLSVATLLRRPSSRNRSPYVGDISFDDERPDAIVHVPSLELGGKCVPDSVLLVQRSRNKKGEPVPADAKGPHGTPKCQYIAKLCRVREIENKNEDIWIGAHPSLGERISETLLAPGETYSPLHSSPVSKLNKQVAGFAGTRSRIDYIVEHEDGVVYAVEIKTVVDTDYDPSLEQISPRLFYGRETPYRRAAIFPWGRAKQKGPDGEKVVSARAIEHIDLLRDIALGRRAHEPHPELKVAVMFIVVRDDAVFFRPNHEGCPTFARHLADARSSGVKVLAHAVRWSSDGSAYCAGTLPVEI